MAEATISHFIKKVAVQILSVIILAAVGILVGILIVSVTGSQVAGLVVALFVVIAVGVALFMLIKKKYPQFYNTYFKSL